MEIVALLGYWDMPLELGVEPESRELDDRAETETAFLPPSAATNLLK